MHMKANLKTHMRPRKTARARYVIGIDEAGRGPLAGPVAVGAVWIDTENKKALRALRAFSTPLKDSKQLSEREREVRYALLHKESRGEGVRYEVVLVGARTIDREGIVHAIKKGIASALKKLPKHFKETEVLLDGGLSAPSNYRQRTFIKGDERFLAIALASIAAKVKRDRVMVRYDLQYPKYGFAKHKGYGTQKHTKAIKKHGLSPLHRKTFCRGLTK